MAIQIPGVGVPPPPGAARDYTLRDLELWNALLAQATIPIQIPTTAAGIQLLNRACLVDGWVLRETTGTGPALVEFFDGTGTGGTIAGEQFIPSSSSVLGGFSDTDVDASSSGGAQANNVTLPGAVGATTFITGFEITGDGATGASIITITVTGILGGTKTYFLNIPAGATVATTQMFVEYSRPIPASATNTAIVVNVPSFGAGNTNAAVTAHGFQRTIGSAGTALGQSVSGPGGIGLQMFKNGVFMNVIAGSVRGVLWVKA